MLRRTKIWKLQKPIVDSTGGDFPTVMAYTENRQNMAMIPMSPEIINELFGDELRVYARARVVNGVLKVKRLVEEQPW